MKKFFKLAEYVYVPLIFAIVGLALVGVGFSKHIRFATGASKLFLGQEVPKFSDAEPEPISKSNIVAPNYGGLYGYLSCDDMDLYVPVYYGLNERTDLKGAVQITPVLPGQPGTIVVTGKSEGGFLWSMKYAQPGRVIDVKTSYGVFSYEIKRVDVGYFTDADIDTSQNSVERLVLKTNYPFEEKENIEPKFDGDTALIICERVSGPAVME